MNVVFASHYWWDIYNIYTIICRMIYIYIYPIRVSTYPFGGISLAHPQYQDFQICKNIGHLLEGQR